MVRIKLAKNILDHSKLMDSYDNDEENENIAKNFLVPCLNSSEKYRRITYCFSSSAIEAWADLELLDFRKKKNRNFRHELDGIQHGRTNKKAFENSIDESKRRKIILKYQDKTSEALALIKVKIA